MRRKGNLYSEICSVENLQLADVKARKGKKRHQKGVKQHDKRKGCDILMLREMLQTKTYRTSKYGTFKVYEPKERDVYRLPYYPDRITHHAVMNVLEPVFVSSFTADTYSCVKGRGIHGAVRSLKKMLCDRGNTTYCLKLDIRKFYPSIDHDVLKHQLRRKFKDNDLLWLLDEIIGSAPGVPIGNYLSQYLANFYLTGFDHWLKEEKGVKRYLRYADDIVILHSSKAYLHHLLADIRQFLRDNLKLELKANYQIFPVEDRGIDFVGYVFFHDYVLLRKSIKKNFARMMKRRRKPASVASYKGWTDHCNSKHLIKKLFA